MSDPLGLLGYDVGEYRIDEFRGSGAFGVVYEATHRILGNDLAMKVPWPGAPPQAQLEFENEGALLVKVNSASRVVDILDTQTETLPVTLAHGGSMSLPVRFHVLELADGCLAEFIAYLDQLDWQSRISLFRDICLATHQLHCKGIVHRDLKTSNVLVFARGSKVIAKLNDLGRARDLNSAPMARVNYEFGRGDPNYAAPEFLWGAGADDRRTHLAADLYGLGSVFVELATGFGITSLAVGPHLGIVTSHQSLALPERRQSYRDRLAEVRSWYQPYFDLVEAAVPPAVRRQASVLVRQLCDPDPYMRFPKIAVGRRGPRPGELTWLLRRVDSMTIALRNAEVEAQRLANKKAAQR